MRLKWFGILVLFGALALTAPRNYIGASILLDLAIGLVLCFGIILIIIDNRTDEKKYIESIKKRRKGGKVCGR